MFDIVPPVATQLILALLTLMCYWLAALLIIAAFRNHFKFKTFRPAVVSLAVLKLALGTECLKRLVTSLTPQGTYWYVAMTRSGWVDDAVNILLLIGVSAVFWTLAVAYPDVRRHD